MATPYICVSTTLREVLSAGIKVSADAIANPTRLMVFGELSDRGQVVNQEQLYDDKLV